MNKNIAFPFLVCICCFVLCSCGTSYEAGTSFIVGDTSWAPWKNSSTWSSIGFRGDYDNIVIFERERPWITYFEFKLDEGQIYDQKSEWSEYTGTAEYYVSESYPTIEDIFKTRGTYKAFPFISSQDGKVKRTAKATIKIFTHNNRPTTYNVFFDNVGFCLCLGDMEFKNSDWVK